MIWRLLFVPIVLSVMLLILSVVLSIRLSELHEPSLLDLYADDVAFWITTAIAVLLMFVITEVRERIIKPILALIEAMHHKKHLEPGDDGYISEEINFLIESFNKYRADSERMHEDLRISAITDPLTQLYNRSSIESLRSRLYGMAQRNGEYMAVAFMDLDCFKQYNDTYGHDAGDEALKTFSTVIGEVFKRPSDIAVRWGGEEFLIYFAVDSLASAEMLAEKLRNALIAKNIEHKGSPFNIMTVSIGLALTDPRDHLEMDRVVNEADQALYKAKESGRNQYVSVNLTQDNQIDLFVSKAATA